MCSRPKVKPEGPKHGSQRERVITSILSEVRSGALRAGERMQSVRVLCERFQMGRSTIQLALEELEQRGFVERKPGNGTFVSEAPARLTSGDGMVLCLPVTGHVYSDLYGFLMQELHSRERIPLVVDSTGGVDVKLLVRALASDADTLVVHGGLHFPFKHLEKSVLKHRQLIGLVDWETEVLRDRTHRVLVDHAEVGRLVARHLFERGHRRVLVLGTSTQIHFLRNTDEAYRGDLQRGFVSACDNLGIAWCPVDAQQWAADAVVLGGQLADLMTLDPGTLLPMLRGPEACTAIFGLMDAHAWAAQHMLAESSQDLFQSVEIIGQGDTPWSAFGKPPFSSVAWNIETIAREAALLIEDACSRRGTLRAGSAPIEVFVKPRLVLRGGPAEQRQESVREGKG